VSSAILRSLNGEALFRANGGRVTAEAKQAFAQALKLDPTDVRARYFIGLALQQAGDPRGAIENWIALLHSAQRGAEWARDLQKQIVRLAATTRVDVKRRMPGARNQAASVPAQADKGMNGPSAEDIRNAEDRTAMVRGMVYPLAERLHNNPDDPDGWIRLMRSRLVLLDEPDAAKAAFGDTMQAFASRPAEQTRIRDAAIALGLSGN